MAENSLSDLKNFFECNTTEFREFWISLSPEEQQYYANADLR